MNKESLENSSRYQSLQAEIRHLKGLLNKVSPLKDENPDVVDRQLDLKLESLLQKKLAYEEVVIGLLQELGRLSAVDRLSIYDYDKQLGGYLAKYQWHNDVFQEYYPTDLIIYDNENPLNNPTHESAFVSCDLSKDLSNSLALKFETFQVKSLLIVACNSKEIANGFFVFETCSFNREWYGFEIQEQCGNVKKIISYLDTCWYKKNAELDARYRYVINKATKILGKEKQAKKSILKTFELIGQELSLNKVYFIPQNSFSKHHDFFWGINPDDEEGVLSAFDVEKLLDNKFIDKGIVFDSSEIKRNNVDLNLAHSLSINLVQINNEFGGWLITEFRDRLNVEKYLLFIDSITHLIEALFGDLYYESELNTRCLYLLEANRGLTLKELFLDGILKNSPLGILKLVDGVIKLTNDKASEIFELSSEQLVNKKLDDLLVNQNVFKYLQKIKKEDSLLHETFELKVGLYTKVLTVTGKLDDSNRVNGHILFLQDITSVQNIKNKYDELRDRYEKILEAGDDGAHDGFKYLAQNTPDIILKLNRDLKVLFYNDALITHFGFLKDKEILGNSLTELGVFNEVVRPTWQAKVEDVFIYGEKVSMELGFSDESKDLYFDWIMAPEFGDNGIVKSVLALGKSLSEHKLVEKQLMEAKEKAEESDKLKSSFLANMSHELRTPLNAIVGFSALLRGDNISAEEIDDYVEVIHKNSDSLMSLINNIIDVAKIESGKISVEKEDLDLQEMLQSLYEDFKSKVEIEHKGRVKLYLSVPKDKNCRIYSDPIRLRQTLVNLIANAIKFTVKGFVEFGYTIVDTKIRFYVKDTGIGISEAKQKVIFQPFRKEVENSNQIYGGTGVGLAICEKIVRALGGEIGLSSVKGKGSEFFFTHPFDVKEGFNEINILSHKTLSISNPVLPKKYYWPNKLILLVDENSSVHLQIRKLIEKTGVTLVSARTAAGASKLLMKRKDISLVIMDLKFPDSTGVELINEIRQLNKEIAVIAYSNELVEGCYDEVLNFGFDACITKSGKKEDLLLLLDKFLVEANNTK